jgi:hypothetical protein
MISTTVSRLELRVQMLTLHLIVSLSEYYSALAFPDGGPKRGVLFAKQGLWPWPSEGALAYADDCGMSMLVGWEPVGVVGLVFDHESANSEAAGGEIDPEDYRPLQWFDTLPEALLPLATRLAQRLRNLTTAGFYALEGGPLLVTTQDASDTHDWCGILDGQFDAEVHSLLPEQVEVCAQVARDLVNARRTLTAEEKAVLLTVPPEWLASGRVSEPDPAPLAQTLERVGVDWGD